VLFCAPGHSRWTPANAVDRKLLESRVLAHRATARDKEKEYASGARSSAGVGPVRFRVGAPLCFEVVIYDSRRLEWLRVGTLVL
jgi:hypothetical protein